MYIFTLAIYLVSYLLISDERLTEVDKRMNPARTPQGSYVTPVIVYLDTGESEEAYDLDLQTFPKLVPYRLLSMVSTLDAVNAGPDNSESGEAYEAEVGASHLNGGARGSDCPTFCPILQGLASPQRLDFRTSPRTTVVY
jgi:hypothetical protein